MTRRSILQHACLRGISFVRQRVEGCICGVDKILLFRHGLGSKRIFSSDFPPPPPSSSSSSSTKTSSLFEVLKQIQDGKITATEAHNILVQSEQEHESGSTTQNGPNMASLESFADIDHARSIRTGFPEAVFAQGKTALQVGSILDDMARSVNESVQIQDSTWNGTKAILATRVSQALYDRLFHYPFQHGKIEYDSVAGLVIMHASEVDKERMSIIQDQDRQRKRVVVATAGTTDIPVAEEAAVTLEVSGCSVDRVYDVGVAGLHRIVRALPRLTHPDVACVVVVAGMDGALPSVVGGLVRVPVIAVPTSIGYGASFGGISAMLTMINSCSPGVAVVNIDNGFGAAAVAFKCIQQ